MTIIRHSDQPVTLGYRQIIGKSTGALATTLWDQTLPLSSSIAPHYHEVEETLTFLNGPVEVTMNGETQIVEADSSVFIPAQTVHQVRNISNEEIRLLAFFPTIEPKVVAVPSEAASQPHLPKSDS